jgi:hypothetical protein
MGLLKSAGRELKGLLRSGELADTFAEAQAYLDGDYGNAMKLSERDIARRRARRRAEEEARRARMFGHEAAHGTAPFAAPE